MQTSHVSDYSNQTCTALNLLPAEAALPNETSTTSLSTPRVLSTNLKDEGKYKKTCEEEPNMFFGGAGTRILKRDVVWHVKRRKVRALSTYQ